MFFEEIATLSMSGLLVFGVICANSLFHRVEKRVSTPNNASTIFTVIFAIPIMVAAIAIVWAHGTALTEQAETTRDAEWRMNFYLVSGEKRFVLEGRDIHEDYVDAELSMIPDAENPFATSVTMRIPYNQWEARGAVKRDTLEIEDLESGRRIIKIVGLVPRQH
ncbi:MAG: hypothetical protein Q7R98_00010 [Candidatus Jorgensenbacteria bacterium]|nr:hypothetical protein [Candidatus Jorgensenbacteria bacterium]